MRKLFSVLAIMLMALTTAMADTVTFTPGDFTGSGTKTVTATNASSGITLTIGQSFSDIQLSGTAFDFGGMGDITVTATAASPAIELNGITMNNDNNTAVDSKTGSGPWTFTAASGGLAPNGNLVASITIDFKRKQQIVVDLNAIIEPKLASLMDWVKYSYIHNEEFETLIYVNDAGKIVKYGYDSTSKFSDDFNFSVDGDNIVATEKNGKN